MTACGHSESHGHALDGAALDNALHEADRRVSSSGERLTDTRRRVLSLLLQAGQPVKAYDLMADYAPDGPPAKPPTVYRALDFLARLGLAHRIESLNAYVACRDEDPTHAAAFLICDCCGAAEETRWDLSAQADAAARVHGYRLDRLSVEAHGRCGACA